MEYYSIILQFPRPGLPCVYDVTDDSTLPKFLWDNIFSYVKLSDVALDAPLLVGDGSENTVALSGDDGPV